MANKDSKMGVGLFLGMVIGALGGIFLAPKSGKESRDAVGKKVGEMKDLVQSGEVKERVQEIFGNVSDESVRMYTNAREMIMGHIEDMKNMNPEDYSKMVSEVVEKVKESSKAGAEQVMKLKDHFVKDYPEMKKEVEKKAARTKEKVAAKKKE